MSEYYPQISFEHEEQLAEQESPAHIFGSYAMASLLHNSPHEHFVEKPLPESYPITELLGVETPGIASLILGPKGGVSPKFKFSLVDVSPPASAGEQVASPLPTEEVVRASDVVVPPHVEPAVASRRRKGFMGLITGLFAPKAEKAGPTAAELIEKRGYARGAPKFRDVVEDDTRNNKFRAMYCDDDDDVVRTEHEGLVELRDFLQSASEQCKVPQLKNRAQAMLENLTFIGEREYAEGAAGLAAYWKQYLDSDPEAQICALAKITPSFSDQRMKSDMYLLDRILRNFTDAELDKYAGRLILDVYDLKAPPEKVRIAMLDDWIVSGSQMSNAINEARYSLAFEYRKCIELNLLVASAKRINDKFFTGTLPIKTYFLAHDASGPVKYPANNAYVSGTHSSVDYDFRDPMSDMTDDVRHVPLPRLARVERGYGKVAPRVEHLKAILSKKHGE